MNYVPTKPIIRELNELLTPNGMTDNEGDVSWVLLLIQFYCKFEEATMSKWLEEQKDERDKNFS